MSRIVIKTTVKGLRRFRSNLKKQERNTVRNVGLGLRAGAEIILEDARDRAPELSGELKRSGRVKPLVRKGSVLETEVAFGGVREVDYAIVVHEDPAQRGRKYLELAEKNNRAAVRAKIGENAKG